MRHERIKMQSSSLPLGVRSSAALSGDFPTVVCGETLGGPRRLIGSAVSSDPTSLKRDMPTSRRAVGGGCGGLGDGGRAARTAPIPPAGRPARHFKLAFWNPTVMSLALPLNTTFQITVGPEVFRVDVVSASY